MRGQLLAQGYSFDEHVYSKRVLENAPDPLRPNDRVVLSERYELIDGKEWRHTQYCACGRNWCSSAVNAAAGKCFLILDA